MQREPLGWPQNLHGTGNDGSVTLRWDRASDNSITGYQYRYSLAAGEEPGEEGNPSQTDFGPWADIPNSSRNTTSHTVTGLTNGREYVLEVRAVRGSVVGWATGVNVTPGAPPATPSPPTGLTLQAGNRQLTANWADVDDIASPRGTITAFRVRYKRVGASSWTNVSRGSGDRSSTQRIRGLTNGTEYEVQVASVNQTVLSTWVSATGTPAVPPPDPPEPSGPLTAPASLNATAGNAQATLRWTNPGDESVTGYQYRYRLSTSNAWNPDWTAISGSGRNTTSHTVTGLTNSREYTFEVRAMRGSTAGPASAATARPATVLRAPGSLTASTTREYGILLSWDAANDSSITHWEYRTRKESESGWDPDWTTIGGNAGTTSSTIEVSTFNERYVIELRAGRGTEDGPSSRDDGSTKGQAAPAREPDRHLEQRQRHPAVGRLGGRLHHEVPVPPLRPGSRQRLWARGVVGCPRQQPQDDDPHGEGTGCRRVLRLRGAGDAGHPGGPGQQRLLLPAVGAVRRQPARGTLQARWTAQNGI